MKYPHPESITLELKREVPRNDQIIKTILAFCNQKGGTLVLGVEDDRTVCGLSNHEVERLLETLESAIYSACSPPILPLVSAKQLGGRSIVEVTVSAGMNPPYFRTSEGLEKGTYVRLGRSTMVASGDMIEELKSKARGLPYDESIVHHASIEDLNSAEIQQFLEMRKIGSQTRVSEEICSAYSLITKEHAHIYATVAGILLFGFEPQKFLPESFIICTHYRGTSGREVLATRDCVGTLFSQFHDAHDWVLSRLNRSFTIQGTRREERLEIPPEAIRETLLNALVHRNYRIPGPTKVAIYEDRVEVFSPGIFPGPLRVSEENLGVTYVRNHAIAKAFREAQYVEKLGSGLITLFSSYRQWNLENPQVIEGEGFVKCILPRIARAGTGGTSIQLLQLVRQLHTFTLKDLMEQGSFSRSTAKRHVEVLLREGVIRRQGKGRGTFYEIA